MNSDYTREQNQIIETIKKNNGYIKGNGPTYSKVMSEDHSPIYQCLKSDIDTLLVRGALYRDGLIVKLKTK